MAFRRRGYERDALLTAVVERAGFKDLLADSEVDVHGQAGKPNLAILPEELLHFDLEQLHDRPVQGELTKILLMPKDDQRFMSCVLIHGMGGTGKTVTAVAVLQEKSIRSWYRFIFWVTVGADAINTQLHQLQVSFHKQVSASHAAPMDFLHACSF